MIRILSTFQNAALENKSSYVHSKKEFWQQFSEIMWSYKGKLITDLQRKLAFQRPDFYSC